MKPARLNYSGKSNTSSWDDIMDSMRENFFKKAQPKSRRTICSDRTENDGFGEKVQLVCSIDTMNFKRS
jgi:hypothetical protein